MTTTYTLTRVFDGDDSPYASTSFTTSDADHINAAHMLAAGFNTMSRNFTIGHVLAVVDTQNGLVHYDGKVEMINRLEPSGPFEGGSFNFEATVPLDPSAVRLFFGDEAYSFTTIGKIAVDEDVPAAVETEPIGPECFGTKNGDRVCWRGRNYVPQDEYEADMRKFADANAEANEAARAEMISFVKRAHAKKVKLQTAVPDGDGRPELDDRWRGMLDVLAKFLVVTGEADTDEGHAVARRLCGIDEEMS
jgi:hypothetical protein